MKKPLSGFLDSGFFRTIRRWSDSLALFWRLMRDAADALEGDALERIAQIQIPISQSKRNTLERATFRVPLDFTDVALRFLGGKSAALDDDGDIVNRHKNPSSGVATGPEIYLKDFLETRQEERNTLLPNLTPIIHHRTKIARFFCFPLKSPKNNGR